MDANDDNVASDSSEEDALLGEGSLSPKWKRKRQLWKPSLTLA